MGLLDQVSSLLLVPCLLLKILADTRLCISPDKPPPPSADPAKQASCNSDQRTALIAVLGLCGAAATFAPFVKNFVLDSRGERIVFPPPHAARVPHSVRDTISGATFPYCMANGRWVWPCTSGNGGWVRQGEFVRVMLFKEGKGVKVASQRKSLLQMFGSMAKKVSCVSTTVQQTFLMPSFSRR